MSWQEDDNSPWRCWPQCGSRHRQRCSCDGQYTPHTEDRPVDTYVEHDCRGPSQRNFPEEEEQYAKW